MKYEVALRPLWSTFVDLEISQYLEKYIILPPENGLVASLTHKHTADITRFRKSTQL
jgi:hypothetical protein